jgi:tetratricopeptide (TPR) repeat protein
VLLLAAGPALAEENPLDLWRDPTFQKQFMGSYGFQAELEPKVGQTELVEMQKVIELMGTDLEAAAAQLELLATPAANAIFDFTLANIRFQQDKLEQAATSYEAALAKFPSFLRAHKNLGLVHARSERFDLAVPSLSRVIELGGGDGLTYGLLGHAYAMTGQLVSAESAYRSAMLLQPGNFDWKLGLTQTLIKQRKHAEAVALCEELIAHQPDRAELWMLQAAAYIGLDQPLQAAENYEVLQRMGKATPQSLFALGDIYTNEALYDLAARAYGHAVEGTSDQTVQQGLRRAEALAQRGAPAQAGTVVERIRQLHGESLAPDERQALLKLQVRLAAASGAGEQALTELEAAVVHDPLDGEALLLLGEQYERRQEPDRAIFYYERAGGIEAFEAEAKTRQARLLVTQLKYREAASLLKRVQELRPREDVARYLEQIERLARARG